MWWDKFCLFHNIFTGWSVWIKHLYEHHKQVCSNFITVFDSCHASFMEQRNNICLTWSLSFCMRAHWEDTSNLLHCAFMFFTICAYVLGLQGACQTCSVCALMSLANIFFCGGEPVGFVIPLVCHLEARALKGRLCFVMINCKAALMLHVREEQISPILLLEMRCHA